MLKASAANVLMLSLCFLTVNSQIEILPKLRVSLSPSTKFYLFYYKRSDHSNTECNISVVEQNAKRKRSLSEFKDLQNAKNCPLSDRVLIPSSLAKFAHNDSDVISETPESITVEYPHTEHSSEHVKTVPSSDEPSITSKHDLTQPKLHPKTKTDVSSVEKAEEIETTIKFTDWQLNYETIGENVQLLHLKYIRAVDSPVKSTYQIECREKNSPQPTRAFLQLILQPHSNLTHRDEYNFAHLLENPPCSCDLTQPACDKNCCCDKNCSIDALKSFGCSEPFRKTTKDLQQPTGHECTRRSISPFCINSETTSFIDRFHPVEPILKTLPMYEKRVPTDKNMDFLMKPHSFHWPAGHYVQGSPIQIKLANGDVAIWTIPKSFFGDECIKSTPVFFQTNQHSKCSVRASQLNCDENGLLNVDFYLARKSGPNTTRRYEFLQELFGRTFAPIELTCADRQNCSDLLTSFNATHCVNPVIEASYKFYWQGPKIERVAIDLLTAPLAEISKSIQQRFNVGFIYGSGAGRTKTSSEENATLPTFRSDANGFCSHDFSSVGIGESTMSSCHLKVVPVYRSSCLVYRRFICEKYENLWRTIESSHKLKIFITKLNFTLCNPSHHVYDTCLEIPTKMLIEVVFADMAKLNVPSYLRILGIRTSLHSTACYPPVGFEPKETNVGSIKTPDEDDLISILCKPEDDVIIHSQIKFIRRHYKQYAHVVDFFRIQLSFFTELFPESLMNELFYLFMDENLVSLPYSLTIFLTLVTLIIISSVFFLNLKSHSN